MSKQVLMFPHIESPAWDAESVVLQRDLARIMIASSRRHMPDLPIVMVTDMKTPAIHGAEPFRIDTGGFSEFIPWLTNACSLIDGEVIYLDSDVVVMRDLRPILNVTGDLIVPNRGPKIVDGHMQPFIFGCVAYRNRKIWEEIRDRVLQMPEKERCWYGSQIAVFEMWMEEKNGRGKWKIVSIPRDVYNYTPKDEDEIPADKWVLHYKGKKRKHWMLNKWRHLLEERIAA